MSYKSFKLKKCVKQQEKVVSWLTVEHNVPELNFSEYFKKQVLFTKNSWLFFNLPQQRLTTTEDIFKVISKIRLFKQNIE